MNNEQGFTLTLRSLLIIILVTVIVLGLAVWFVVHRLEQDNVELDEPTVTVTPSPTPEQDTVTDFFENSLSTGLTIISALTDTDPTNDNVTDSLARNNFLKMLASQMGSSGEIITNSLSTYAYYTEWYIGGYEANPGWSKDTPWCASYISWCLEQVNLSINGDVPRYANVDNFYAHFPLEAWLFPGDTPNPGDIVFFGFLNDPNHMGVVLAADQRYIYTIEGNTNDTVGIRRYELTDPNIMGYGLLNWAN